MIGDKRKLIDGDEYDCIMAKKYFCYLSRAGTSKDIKRRIIKRQRRKAKQELNYET